MLCSVLKVRLHTVPLLLVGGVDGVVLTFGVGAGTLLKFVAVGVVGGRPLSMGLVMRLFGVGVGVGVGVGMEVEGVKAVLFVGGMVMALFLRWATWVLSLSRCLCVSCPRFLTLNRRRLMAPCRSRILDRNRLTWPSRLTRSRVRFRLVFRDRVLSWVIWLVRSRWSRVSVIASVLTDSVVSVVTAVSWTWPRRTGGHVLANTEGNACGL